MQNEQAKPLEPIGASKNTILEVAGLYAEKVDLTPGAPLEPLVMRLGGKIEYLDFFSATEHDENSIVIRAKEDFTIYLPPHTGDARDRFTLAHEIGHYLLQYKQEDGIRKARRSGKERVEREANWFAAGLLMPEKYFKALFQKLDGDVQKLAQAFGVSRRTADIRIEELKLG